jgi:hypothetical protein
MKVLLVLAFLVLGIALWPVFAWFCLNFVAGFALSFWQVVGIGWLVGATAQTATP